MTDSDCISVTVRLLEMDQQKKISVPSNVNGKWLLDEVCKQQDVLEESEYFGLRYLSCVGLSEPTKKWLELTSNVHKQLKHTNPLKVSFRIKHYPPNPFTDFILEKSKYLLFYQLYRDFVSGRLIAPNDVTMKLAALFTQVILGDISTLNDSTEVSNSDKTYLENFRAMHSMTKRNETEIIEEHRRLRGLLPNQAITEAAWIASRLESYGFEPFRVQTKHHGRHPVHIGLTHEGVAVFSGSKRSSLFKWNEIEQIFYTRKHFIVVHSNALKKGKKPSKISTDYKCESRAIAANLWAWAVERKLFFTLEKSAVVKPVTSKYSLLSKRHTFKFAGRCRTEVLARKSSTLPNSYSAHRTFQSDAKSDGWSIQSHPIDYLKLDALNSSEPAICCTTATANSVFSGSLKNVDEKDEYAEVIEDLVIAKKKINQSVPENKVLNSFEERNSKRNISTGHSSKDDFPQSKRTCSSQQCTTIQSDTCLVETPNKSVLDSEVDSFSVSDNYSQFRCPWRSVLFSGGILLALSCMGAVLLSELEVHSPIFDRLRSSSTFISWDQHLYRPIRSIILGFVSH